MWTTCHIIIIQRANMSQPQTSSMLPILRTTKMCWLPEMTRRR